MKLHLGCGKRNWEGWTNIDGATYPHIHSHDIVNIPFSDNSIDEIYASHVFEYFDREYGKNVLLNWYRKLRPGGMIRLAVPDFQAMAKLYSCGRFGLDSFLGPLYGKMEMDGKTIYHKTVYDFESISSLLSDVGFIKIKRYDSWKFLGAADDCSKAYLPKMDWDGTLISLNVIATKL